MREDNKLFIRNWIARFIENALERLRAPFYRKSLMTVLTIACLPIVLIGIMVYVTGVRQIENESNRMHQMQLTQAYDRIEEYLSHLELVSSQWAFHSNFDIRLQTMNLRDQFDETQNLYVSLSALERTDTMIGEVLLYLRNQQVTISPVEGVVPLQDSNRGTYSQLLKEQGKVYWTHTLSQGIQPGKNRAPLSLVIKLPGIGNVESFGAIIVHLDNTKVAHLFNDAYRQEEGASFILRKDGTFVARGGQAAGEVAKNELEQALSQYVLAQGADSGSVVYRYKSNAYSLSYQSMNRLGSEWIYVTATPLTKLTAPVKTLSRLIIGVSVMVMLIAVILSWLASGRLYGPVHRLVRLFQGGREEDRSGDEFAFIEDRWSNISRESQMLQTRLEHQLPAMREGFFLQLVQGHLYHLSESDIRERLEQLGWDTENRIYVLVVLQLTGVTNLSGRFSEGDEPLIGFAAANIINEMAFPLKGLKHVIHFQDLSFGLLLSLPEEEWNKKWKADMLHKLQEWMSALNTILHLQATASIGVPTPSVHQIPQAMEDAKRGLRYRSLQQDNQVLDMDELLPQGRDPVSYPFAVEKEVIQAVRLGLEEETIEALRRFMDEYRLRTDTELHVQQGMLQLLG
ncbi:MAG: transcriptional regulator, partial [Paenibacillus sp.]|nr:transcriptional regulator [Paenibacillus sp.]